MLFLPSGGGINFSENGGCKITDYISLPLHRFIVGHCPALGPAEVRLERFRLLLFKGDWVHTYARMKLSISVGFRTVRRTKTASSVLLMTKFPRMKNAFRAFCSRYGNPGQSDTIHSSVCADEHEHSCAAAERRGKYAFWGQAA